MAEYRRPAVRRSRPTSLGQADERTNRDLGTHSSVVDPGGYTTQPKSFSGFSSFVALTGGIPAQIFLLPMGLERQLFVGTMSFYFLIINLAKLPFFFDLQLFTSTSIMVSIVVLPILPIGIYLGKLLNKKLSDRLFYHISHSALFLCGLNLICQQIL